MERIDAGRAKEIAENFLRQHYSVISIGRPNLVGDFWVVDVLVSSSTRRKFEVRVNATTGQVEGF